MRMASRYGHTWVSQFGASPGGIAAVEWRETLAGLTPAQIREGFDADAVRGDDWPPSSPRFRALCMGIPTLGSVRAEIRDMLNWSGRGQGSVVSRFARGVWSRINVYSYRSADGKLAERMLREAYELTRESVMEGGTLPVEPVAMVEHKPDDTPRRPADPEVVREHIARMKELLKTEPVKPHAEVDDESPSAA